MIACDKSLIFNGFILFGDNDSRAQLLNNAHGTNSHKIASELRILTLRYIIILRIARV